jgi:hypothetical protein
MSSGDVAFIDPQSGKPLALPFRPPLEPEETVQWRRPAVVGNGQAEFVIADQQGNLYRIGIKTSPQRQLAQLAVNRLDSPIDSTLAAVGDTVYGVTSIGSTDVVIAIRLSDLSLAQEFDLQGGRVTWGPCAVGSSVLLVVDNRQLHCFASGHQARWASPGTALGLPAGLPLLDGQDYLFSARGGAVWRIAGDSGQLVQQMELGEPIDSGPVAFGPRMVLCGHDGSVHIVSMLRGS